MNKAIILGRITKDLELKNLPAGTSVLNFSVATNESYKDKNGEKVEKTEFHNVVCFGKTAEIVAKFSAKGKRVMIEGKIQTRMWTDKDENKRYSVEIVANNVSIIDFNENSDKAVSAPAQGANFDADQIPF